MQRALCRSQLPPLTAAATADRLVSAADHASMRAACETGVAMVRAPHEVASMPHIFTVRLVTLCCGRRFCAPERPMCPSCFCVPVFVQPSPIDQLYQRASCSFMYHFNGHHLQPDLLKRALQGVLTELPHLAGRGCVLGSGSRLIDSVIKCSNEGATFTTASAPNIRWPQLPCFRHANG